jgi:hypothetical protein
VGRSKGIEALPPADDPVWLEDSREVVLVIEQIEDTSGMFCEIPIEDADAALIVKAPDDIAALVAEVKRLRAQLQAST